MNNKQLLPVEEISYIVCQRIQLSVAFLTLGWCMHGN
jgi:hypothetical protein